MARTVQGVTDPPGESSAFGRLVGDRVSRGLGIAVLAFIAITVAYPALAMVRRFLKVAGERNAETLSFGSTVDIVGFTITQAALSTLLTLAAGLPLAHVLAEYSFRGRRVVEVATLVPFVLPTVVVAIAVQRALISVGMNFDGIDGSLPAILIAHVVFNVAVVVRVVGVYWRAMDRRPNEAAAVLGSTPLSVFWRVTLPRLRPALVAASAVVFLFTFTSFGVIVILGGLSRSTIETEIYRYAITRNDFSAAALLAVVQAVAVGGLAYLNQRLQGRVGASGGSPARRRWSQTMSWQQVLHAGTVIVITLGFLLSPFALLAWRSVRVDSGFGLDHYAALALRPAVLPISPARAVVHSVVFAAAAAIVATVIGVAASVSAQVSSRLARIVETAVLVPLGISAVTLGFGYLVGFTFLELRRSPVLVVVAHAVIGLPFVVAALLPAIRSLDNGVLDAGVVLGATPAHVLRRIALPLLRPAILAGAGFAAAVSLGEFGASGFLARGRSSFTAPQAVFGLLGQPGADFQGQAAALCIVLGLLVVLVVLLIDRGRSTLGRGWL